MAQDHFDIKLSEIATHFHSVNGSQRGHMLLDEFLKRRANLFGVHSEDGQPIGVVSLSDVIDELIGND